MKLWLSIFENDTHVAVVHFGKLNYAFRIFASRITAFVVIIMFPTYIALSASYNSYQHEYAWITSAPYLSGLNATIVLVIEFWLLFVLVRYGLHKIVKSSDNHLLNRQSRVSSAAVEPANNNQTTSDLQRYAIYVIIATVNIVVMIAVNGAYVYISITSTQRVVQFAQFVLANFKLVWNEVCLQRGLRYLQAREVLKRPDVVSNITLVVVMVLLNNIIIPSMATAAISSECFYFLLVPAPAVTAVYSFSECAQYDIARAKIGVVESTPCINNVISSTNISYNPPFQYSYQCSSVIVTNYATIYMYMFIIITVYQPLKNLVAWCWINRNNKGDKTQPASKLTSFVDYLTSINRFSSLSFDTPRYDHTNKKNVRKWFNVQKYTVRIYSYFIILVTFGALCPPLAIVGMIAIYAFTYHELNVTGKLLSDAKDKHYLQLISYMEKDFGLANQHFARTIWLIVPFASLFIGYFVFDTLGDSVGWKNALWAPLVLISFPLFAWITNKIYCYISVYWSNNNNQTIVDKISANKKVTVEKNDDNVIELVDNPIRKKKEFQA